MYDKWYPVMSYPIAPEHIIFMQTQYLLKNMLTFFPLSFVGDRRPPFPEVPRHQGRGERACSRQGQRWTQPPDICPQQERRSLRLGRDKAILSWLSPGLTSTPTFTLISTFSWSENNDLAKKQAIKY